LVIITMVYSFWFANNKSFESSISLFEKP
jgi:hypothetical protein